MRQKDTDGFMIWESLGGPYIQVDKEAIRIYPKGEGAYADTEERIKDLKEAIKAYEAFQ